MGWVEGLGWVCVLGGLVHDVTPKKSWQMTQFYCSPSTTGHVHVLLNECVYVCEIMVRFMVNIYM